MHEIQERTILALPHIFEELRTRGYTIVLFVPQGMRVPVPQRVAAP